jgi:hypothetical protein
VSAFFFVIAYLILYQQKVTYGVWFQISDLHHETFAIASFAIGLGIIIGAVINSSEPK